MRGHLFTRRSGRRGFAVRSFGWQGSPCPLVCCRRRPWRPIRPRPRRSRRRLERRKLAQREVEMQRPLRLRSDAPRHREKPEFARQNDPQHHDWRLLHRPSRMRKPVARRASPRRATPNPSPDRSRNLENAAAASARRPSLWPSQATSTAARSHSKRISSSKASGKNRMPFTFFAARRPGTTGLGSTRSFYLWCLSPYRILCSNPCLGGWTPSGYTLPLRRLQPLFHFGRAPSARENARQNPPGWGTMRSIFLNPQKQPGSTCYPETTSRELPAF